MAKTSAIVFGVIFIIAGIWGFVSSPVLGLFGFTILASAVHVIAGIVLLAIAGKSSAIRTLKTVGIIYVVFFVLSLLGVTLLGNTTSGWLYFILGFVITILAFSGKKHATVVA